MNIIRSMVDFKMSIEDVNYLNGLIVRDEALPVIGNKDDEIVQCPICKQVLCVAHTETNFCRKCGQRLDVENFVI